MQAVAWRNAALTHDKRDELTLREVRCVERRATLTTKDRRSQKVEERGKRVLEGRQKGAFYVQCPRDVVTVTDGGHSPRPPQLRDGKALA